jgi:hypothetical protein
MTLAEFFLKLATDRELFDRFSGDEQADVIAEADLSDAHRELLRSGTLVEIRGRIEIEFEIEGEPVRFVTVYVLPITVYCPPPPPEST